MPCAVEFPREATESCEPEGEGPGPAPGSRPFC